MCGIVGYIGKKEAVPILITGLRRLEYRGYDSAGVAIIEDGKLEVIKRPGKVEHLAAALPKLTGKLGIGHTRWATHGVPNERNAHPQVSHGRIAIVHNGIIENFSELKRPLEEAGYTFTSDTDTEVLAHLIHAKLATEQDLLAAVISALKEVIGTFGLAIIDLENPEQLVAARRGSPLLIGLGKGEMYVASDATAVIGHTSQVVYLEDDEVALCQADDYRIYNLENQERQRQSQTVEMELGALEKGGYEHFLLKEIMEQPKSVTDILRGRLDHANGISHLGGLNLSDNHLRTTQRLLVIGCGTAYYAGLLGKYLLERMTGIPVDVEYGSEFRYRDAALADKTLAVFVSQSGETADTLAGLAEVKRKGLRTLGLVNVVGSTLARGVDGGIYLHAGPEISVASTKAFTAQVIAQLMLGLEIARLRGLSLADGQMIVEALQVLPSQIEVVLQQAEPIRALARKYAKFENAMYLGRDSLFPVALEGSHKLKEISYIYAEAYPAGEMKHGANALIDENLLVVFLAPKTAQYAKAKSNLEEVKARNGRLLVMATEGDDDIAKLADDVITIPDVSPWTLPIIANIPLQLFAYYVAVERGTDVDQPRNLAKSVTVE